MDFLRWLFDETRGPAGRLLPRWLFLRALGAIYFSAFYSLLFQIRGLIGPRGVLPAEQYLAVVAHSLDLSRYWYAPSLFWLSASDRALLLVTWIGLTASLCALLNLWPRLSFFLCWVCFLAFVSSSSEFSSYQSDGMLLEAGFLALFFAPRGLLPGLGAAAPPTRASLWLLQWEWFRIYFESGMVKLLSGDQQWRNLTAMDEYYQNGPLPTWIGWYVEHLPHWFHAATALGTLVLELGIVLLVFFPRRVRLLCFLIVTPWEIGVILTANYTFLNYLVLSLGFLLLDDQILGRFLPARPPAAVPATAPPAADPDEPVPLSPSQDAGLIGESTAPPPPRRPPAAVAVRWAGVAISVVMLTWIGYDTTVEMIGIAWRSAPLPTAPVAWLDPLRIANQYGLFAVMTRGRYDIEFQGSDDAVNWSVYPFRNKPQALNQPPRIYAPYQPRFDWNLWFASLGEWRQTQIVLLTEERLLDNDPEVLGLFAGDPFAGRPPPRFVRAVLWQYWFTSIAEKRRTGNWWRRQLLGLYAPELTKRPDGRYAAVAMPDDLGTHD